MSYLETYDKFLSSISTVASRVFGLISVFEVSLFINFTKCWVEKMEKISAETAHIGDSYISFFTHEWCFDEQLERIEKLIKLYYMADYIFV